MAEDRASPADGPAVPPWVIWPFLVLPAVGACGAFFTHDDGRKVACVTVAVVAALVWVAAALNRASVRAAVNRHDGRVVNAVRGFLVGPLPIWVVIVTNTHSPLAYLVSRE